MKIVWNKVNWYAQTIAIILFVLIFLLGMKLGAQKQKSFDSAGLAQPAQSATVK
jgi:uncharacterized membrane protein